MWQLHERPGNCRGREFIDQLHDSPARGNGKRQQRQDDSQAEDIVGAGRSAQSLHAAPEGASSGRQGVILEVDVSAWFLRERGASRPLYDGIGSVFRLPDKNGNLLR